MRLTDLWELAKQNNYHNIENNKFILKCPNGKNFQCEWLDAHYGMFLMEGLNGFVSVNQLDFASEDCAELIFN